MKSKPTSPKRRTPPEVYHEVCNRVGGIWLKRPPRCIFGFCEFCQDHNRDWRGHCYAHLVHRKLGGSTDPKIHSAENVRYSCYPCHEYLDGRRRMLPYISESLAEARAKKLAKYDPT